MVHNAFDEHHPNSVATSHKFYWFLCKRKFISLNKLIPIWILLYDSSEKQITCQIKVIYNTRHTHTHTTANHPVIIAGNDRVTDTL